DRRMIRDRMAKIRRELERVKRTRGLHRDRRQRAPWPVVALFGYTNAGKSTLFNRLTGESVFAENLLFATLDPTMRDIKLPGFDKVILSDTVGFVSDLPTALIEAWNKVDLLSGEEHERLYEEARRRDDVVPISAVTGVGLDELRQHMAECLRSGEQVHQIRLPASAGGKIAWLHARGEVLEQRLDEDEVELSVRLSPDNWARFQVL